MRHNGGFVYSKRIQEIISMFGKTNTTRMTEYQKNWSNRHDPKNGYNRHNQENWNTRHDRKNRYNQHDWKNQYNRYDRNNWYILHGRRNQTESYEMEIHSSTIKHPIHIYCYQEYLTVLKPPCTDSIRGTLVLHMNISAQSHLHSSAPPAKYH